MEKMVQIPVKEYESMKEAISLLKDNLLLQKVNRLVELLYEEKYGLYLGNDTSDLTAAAVQHAWPQQNSPWDDV